MHRNARKVSKTGAIDQDKKKTLGKRKKNNKGQNDTRKGKERKKDRRNGTVEVQTDRKKPKSPCQQKKKYKKMDVCREKGKT